MLSQRDKIKHHLNFQNFLALTRDYYPHTHMYFENDCNVQPSGSHSIPWSRRMGRRFALEPSAVFLLRLNKQHRECYVESLSVEVGRSKLHTQHHIDSQLDGQTGSSGTVGYLVNRVCLLLLLYDAYGSLQLFLRTPALFQVC